MTAKPPHPTAGVGLRERLIEAASKVFLKEGYENLSMRRVAQEAGCSQMAMYRHFANKEALTQYICTEIYTRFAAEMNREILAVADPWQQIQRYVEALIRFATTYPDHYSLIFLVRHSNPEVIADRERLGKEFIEGLHPIVKALLPSETRRPVVDRLVRQMLSCLHGTAALLIAHPKAYGLTKSRAVQDAEAVLRHLFDRE
jgi:AcrR family transcriptional regulator